MKNKSILITGMTGSLGTALSKYFLTNQPKRLVCFSRCWQKQLELKSKLGNPSFARWFIGDVRDKERLKQAMIDIDIVIHTAAIKEIEVCQYNPFEAVQTNVIGTENVISTAIESGVKKVLVIGTDKSANAFNCYGKTKALAEELAIASNVYARKSKTKISVCRYGNVIGSNGSVIPLFQEQAKSGTLTITDRQMTRFWITSKQAVKFVCKCLDLMQGGEILVPKIPSARIVDVAKAIAPKAKLKIIGIRCGEKLQEDLITIQEARYTKEYKDYYVIEPMYSFWSKPATTKCGMKEGWWYSSDRNTQWLSVENIKKLI